MEISFRLDTETGPIDPVDLLGDVKMLGDSGVINETDVYVDSWLESLLDACDKLAREVDFEQFIPEFPDPLHFSRRVAQWQLSWEEQQLTFGDTDAFKKSVIAACRALVFQTAQLKGSSDNTILARMKELV